MAMKPRDHLQTMAYAYQEICQGEEPWVALGNFLNYWFEYAKDQREELVRDPILAGSDKKSHRWAAYCAASVEHLCRKYAVACPSWVYHQEYVLPTPWYCDRQTHLREWLVASTPDEFRKRNVYSGDRMFLNKWELGDLTAKLKEINAKKVSTVHP